MGGDEIFSSVNTVRKKSTEVQLFALCNNTFVSSVSYKNTEQFLAFPLKKVTLTEAVLAFHSWLVKSRYFLVSKIFNTFAAATMFTATLSRRTRYCILTAAAARNTIGLHR